MSPQKCSRDLLARTAKMSRSLTHLMAELGVPAGNGPRNYLRRRLLHYRIDTSHFIDEPLPAQERRSYSRELLQDAAARAYNLGELLGHLGFVSQDGPYSHIRKRLDQFEIDTSHFTSGAGHGPKMLPCALLRPAVAASRSLADVLRLLKEPDNGATRKRLKQSIEFHGIPTGHFTGQGHNRGVPSLRRKTAAETLVRKGPGSARTKTAQLRRALDDLDIPHRCEVCGTGDTWQGRRLVLEIDHINGDRLDDRRTNLRYLCPSCHSQTVTSSRGSRARRSCADQ